MTAPVIAVLGGSGEIGATAAAMLAARGSVRLRLGGRSQARLESTAAGLGSSAEVMPVDIFDDAGLAAFCRGARIVVNCAGPSYLVKDRVGAAALAAGADYVDVAGDDPAHEGLTARDVGKAGRVAVLSAGVLPGASNLVAQWAAGDGFDQVNRLVAHAGGLERLTITAAQDVVLSLGGAADGTWYGESLAAWRGGRRVSRVLRPEADVELPFFPGTVSVQPYLITGCERLATSLGLTEMDWHMVSDGERLHAALNKHRGLPLMRSPALADAGADISRAAGLDLAGRDPYFVMLFQLTGRQAGREVQRTVVLRTSDSYRLSSATAVATVLDLLEDAIEPGVHYVDDVLNPQAFMAELEKLGAVDSLHSFAGSPGLVEEGAL